eukprot:2038285-Amphidinium_carterae.1
MLDIVVLSLYLACPLLRLALEATGASSRTGAFRRQLGGVRVPTGGDGLHCLEGHAKGGCICDETAHERASQGARLRRHTRFMSATQQDAPRGMLTSWMKQWHIAIIRLEHMGHSFSQSHRYDFNSQFNSKTKASCQHLDSEKTDWRVQEYLMKGQINIHS